MTFLRRWLGRGTGAPVQPTDEETDVPVEKITGFACSCGAKNKAEIQEVRDWVKDKLTYGNGKYPCTDANLVTKVTYALLGYNVHVEGIYTDQWSAIAATSYGKDRPKVSIWMQCDLIEDGFAYLYKALYDRFGEGDDV